jgi:hypothetical protein
MLTMIIRTMMLMMIVIRMEFTKIILQNQRKKIIQFNHIMVIQIATAKEVEEDLKVRKIKKHSSRRSFKIIKK